MSYEVRRDAWHELIESFGERPIRNLPSRFDGKGVKQGYRYYQIQENPVAFLYEVTHINSNEKHYEVFERWMDNKEKRDIYPYEEPVKGTIQTSKNSAAAMQMWIELTRKFR